MSYVVHTCIACKAHCVVRRDNITPIIDMQLWLIACPIQHVGKHQHTRMKKDKSGFKDTKLFSKAKAKVATFTIEFSQGF